MGYRFQNPDIGNPNGYFEDRDFQHANALLMGAHKMRPKVHREYMASPGQFAEGWKRHVEKVIALRWEIGLPWGIKDPHIAYILETYTELLPTARIIQCTRPLDKVVASFERLYGWEHSQAVRTVEHRMELLACEVPAAVERLGRPALALDFGERQEEDELAERIAAWMRETSDGKDGSNARTDTEQRRQGSDAVGQPGVDGQAAGVSDRPATVQIGNHRQLHAEDGPEDVRQLLRA